MIKKVRNWTLGNKWALCRLVITWYKNRHTGTQIAHWDILTKQDNLNFLCFRCPTGQLASQYGGFCTMWSLTCKGPIILISKSYKHTCRRGFPDQSLKQDHAALIDKENTATTTYRFFISLDSLAMNSLPVGNDNDVDIDDDDHYHHQLCDLDLA